MNYVGILGNDALVFLIIVLALLLIMFAIVSKGMKRFCLLLIGLISALSCFTAGL